MSHLVALGIKLNILLRIDDEHCRLIKFNFLSELFKLKFVKLLNHYIKHMKQI